MHCIVGLHMTQVNSFEIVKMIVYMLNLSGNSCSSHVFIISMVIGNVAVAVIISSNVTAHFVIHMQLQLKRTSCCFCIVVSVVMILCTNTKHASKCCLEGNEKKEEKKNKKAYLRFDSTEWSNRISPNLINTEIQIVRGGFSCKSNIAVL